MSIRLDELRIVPLLNSELNPRLGGSMRRASILVVALVLAGIASADDPSQTPETFVKAGRLLAAR